MSFKEDIKADWDAVKDLAKRILCLWAPASCGAGYSLAVPPEYFSGQPRLPEAPTNNQDMQHVIAMR